MKKSDIRRIVHEEIVKALREQSMNEAFGDPLAAELSKMRGAQPGRYRNFWRTAAKTFDIAWDKLPKGSFRKVQPSSSDVKKGMAFYVIKSDKKNPYANTDRYGYSFDSEISGPSVLAVTVDNKIQYLTSGGGMANKTAAKRYGRSPEPLGRGIRGTMMLKKLKELADVVYLFDLESYRGGTTALKSKRAELKLGKDTFKDANSWKKANMARYKQILANRIGSRDQVDALVAKAVKATNAAVEEGMSVPKLGRYDQLMTTLNGNEVEMRAVTYYQGKALELYAKYIQMENQEEREKDGYGGSYYAKEKKKIALELKNVTNSIVAGKIRY